jgi:carbonic anhydrase
MSEHTIDGKHRDLEMHIVHLGEKDYKGQHPGDVKYAAVGIMFSLEDFDDDIEEE